MQGCPGVKKIALRPHVTDSCYSDPRPSDQMALHHKWHKWVFIGRTDVEAETPILWPPDAKSWLIWKDPDAGKDWGQEEKGIIEDEMVGWHHRLNGHGFGWTQGVVDGQGGLACCSSWGCKELDTTEWLNWIEYLELDSLQERLHKSNLQVKRFLREGYRENGNWIELTRLGQNIDPQGRGRPWRAWICQLRC